MPHAVVRGAVPAARGARCAVRDDVCSCSVCSVLPAVCCLMQLLPAAC
jgi:hypothetical protein